LQDSKGMLTLHVELCVRCMDEKLNQVINLLEDRLKLLLADYQDLEKAFDEMHDAFQKKVLQNEKLNLKIEEVVQENKLLKSANALLGSDDYKRETKLKINALIKEIDQCIAQLS